MADELANTSVGMLVASQVDPIGISRAHAPGVTFKMWRESCEG